MAESDLIDRTEEPVTRDGLVADLKGLGVPENAVLLVHMSLSRVGWVVGGTRTVIDALLEAIGDGGTLVMPAFSADLYDPAGWRSPPVPESWHDIIRAHTPAFDPARTASSGMGRVAEQFRTWPGARRSHHPTDSLAAGGPHAEAITASQPLAFGLGSDGPLGRLYDLGGYVLLVGVGHNSNSSLHLAEARAANGRREERTVPVIRDGKKVWVTNSDVRDDKGDLFPRIGADFEATGAVRIGHVGQAESRLMPQNALVDFASAWLEKELAAR